MITRLQFLAVAPCLARRASRPETETLASDLNSFAIYFLEFLNERRLRLWRYALHVRVNRHRIVQSVGAAGLRHFAHGSLRALTPR